MNAAQRMQRRHDLLLAADVLRRDIDASLTNLEPTVEPVMRGLAIARWLRHRRWLGRAWIVWRVLKLLRR